jgi:hypothetical protein
MVFGKSFQSTFFVLAVVGLSNWSFWLPASLPAAPAPITTQRRFGVRPPPRPFVDLPFPTVAESQANTSLLVANEGTTNGPASPQRTAAAGALHLPSSGPNALSVSPPQTEPEAKAKPQASIELGALAPAFIENRGQFDGHVKFQVRGNGKTVWLTDKGVVFDFMREKSDGRSAGRQ